MIGEINRRRVEEKPLGLYLVEAGLITPTQVEMALNEQKVSRKCLGQILADQGWVKQQTVEYLMKKVVLPDRRVVEKKLCDLGKNGYHEQTTVEQASQAKREESYSPMLLASPLRELQIYFSPKRTVRFLFFVVLSLVIAHIVVKLLDYSLPDYPSKDTLVRLFQIDGEQNIPALYSTSALLLCSVLLATIAYAKKVAGDRYFRQWVALSTIFLYISFDEALSIHETIIKPLRSALNAGGFLYFTWVIPGTIFVLICLLAFLRFLAHLPAKTRRLFLIAGSIFVGGAIGMELVGGYYADFYGEQNMTYAIIVAIEEFLEMLGIIVFMYALLSYMSSYMKDTSLRINITDDRKQRRNA